MQTVYVVAIIAASIGILALAYVFRKRLTGLVIRHGSSSLELQTDRATKEPPTLDGPGVILDESKIRNSDVKLSDAKFIAQQSDVKDSTFDVQTSSPPKKESSD